MSTWTWPKVETAKPYDLTKVHPDARPKADRTLAPDAIPFDANKPRLSANWKSRGAKNVVYWCLSCNRRVANANQPFCRRHRKAREEFTRERRNAQNKPVKVARKRVVELHDILQRLDRARYDLNHGDSDDRGRAWLNLQRHLDELDLFARLNLPKELDPRLMPPEPQDAATKTRR